MNRKRPKSATERPVYQEFGHQTPPPAQARPDPPPSAQKLTVQASRKGRKGKTVTVISGFQISSTQLTALAKQLKGQCGSGGTVKDMTIEIQGDHRQKLVQVLTQLGYPVKISGG